MIYPRNLSSWISNAIVTLLLLILSVYTIDGLEGIISGILSSNFSNALSGVFELAIGLFGVYAVILTLIKIPKSIIVEGDGITLDTFFGTKKLDKIEKIVYSDKKSGSLSFYIPKRVIYIGLKDFENGIEMPQEIQKKVMKVDGFIG